MQIIIDDRYKALCPAMEIGSIECRIANCPTPDALWAELTAASARLSSRYELLAINRRPAIAATRALYKALGKDPNRYRGASEALCRRIIRGLGLYRLTAAVDLINLLSVVTGYAISGIDADKVAGDRLTLSVGTAADEYYGIGRGRLNVEGLPMYRDAIGGIATPTSDEERIKIELGTTHLLININAFAPEEPMEQAIALAERLLRDYASATEIEIKTYRP